MIKANEIKRCNMCGKEFDVFDKQEDFCIDKYVGYGSKFDLCHVQLNLCIDCFDRLITKIRPECKIDPVIGEYHLAGES